MKTSETIGALAAALSAAQGELHNVEKNKEGYGYNYADIAAILDVARPILSRHGLSVVQFPQNSVGGISVTTRLMHGSGEWLEDSISMPVEEAKNLSAAQACGVVITYCRRYSLAAVLGIAQEDSDAATNDKTGKTQETKTVVLPPKAGCISAAQAAALKNNIHTLGLNLAEFLVGAGVRVDRLSDITKEEYRTLSQLLLLRDKPIVNPLVTKGAADGMA